MLLDSFRCLFRYLAGYTLTVVEDHCMEVVHQCLNVDNKMLTSGNKKTMSLEHVIKILFEFGGFVIAEKTMRW